MAGKAKFIGLIFLILFLFIIPLNLKAESNILYQENFDDEVADYWEKMYTYGVGWQEEPISGISWEVVEGKYHLIIPTYRQGVMSIYQKGFDWQDYILETDVYLNDGVDRNIIFRWQDHQNYYSVGLRGFWRWAPDDTPVIYLSRCYQGVCIGHQYWQYFAAYHFEDKGALNNEIAHIDIEVEGNRTKVFYNNKLVIDWQEETEQYPHSGTIGLGAWTGHYERADVAWDNIVVKTIKEKEVPLYTQVRSSYPSIQDTESWFDLPYAEGLSYTCGSKIYQCGCAITSAVMIARYYDVLETQGKDVNPKEINNWLKNELGGYFKGSVNWVAAAKYTNWRIKYEKTDKATNNYVLLDEKLNNNQPVIAKASAGRGGVNLQHFFIIDGKRTSTYSVKDPAWYNTKTLNETTDVSNYIRGYENGFDGLRIYKKGNGIAQSAMTIALGSPAELLITDSQGRKLGRDKNGIEYNEIPDAWYFEDGFDDPSGENPPAQERNKLIQILEPIDGQYQLQVIGTGEGNYTLQSTFYDTQGASLNQEFHSEIAPDYIAQYNLSFDSADSNNTIIEFFDETSPEAKIFFDPIAQKLTIQGTDNTTVNPVVFLIEQNKELIYQIQDEAKNTAKLFFEKFKQEGKEIKAELKAIQYNNESIVELPKTELKFEWSLDKKTNQIKELEQRIKVKNSFDIKAKYNHEKDETRIKIKLRNQEEQEKILSGLVIIELITKSGILEFRF